MGTGGVPFYSSGSNNSFIASQRRCQVSVFYRAVAKGRFTRIQEPPHGVETGVALGQDSYRSWKSVRAADHEALGDQCINQPDDQPFTDVYMKVYICVCTKEWTPPYGIIGTEVHR